MHDFFGKSESKMIYGIAIIMMMTHHFFGFQSYLLPENSWTSLFSIRGIEVERMFAAFGKLCVALFAFCSGYALWKFKESYSSWSKIIKRLLRFLISYWIIFALFLIYAIIFHDNIPHGIRLLKNLVGLDSGPEYNYVNVTFSWYVTYYCALLLLARALIKIFNRKNRTTGGVRSTMTYNIITDLAIVFLISAVLKCLSNVYNIHFLSPLPASLIGLFIGKYGLFELTYAKMQKLINIPAMLLLIVAIAVLRQGLILVNCPDMGIRDGIFSFGFIFAVIVILRRLNWNWLDKSLIFLGYISMNLWYLHGIFFSGEKKLQWILYYPQYPIFILIWGMIMLIPIALFCSKVQNGILKVAKLA